MHVDDKSTHVDVNSNVCQRKLQVFCRHYLHKLVAETVCRCYIHYPNTETQIPLELPKDTLRQLGFYSRLLLIQSDAISIVSYESNNCEV